MSKYEQPLLITYGWACPIHHYHQKQVALSEKPRGNKIIDQNTCTDQFPDTPIYRTRLFGNLRLEVNKVYSKSTPKQSARKDSIDA